MKAEEDTACLAFFFRMFGRTVGAEWGLLAKVPARRRAEEGLGVCGGGESTCLQRGGELGRRTALGLARRSPTCEAQTQGVTQAPGGQKKNKQV